MISPRLTTIATELQQAAARRDYARVEQLALRAGEIAAEEAHALPAGDAGILEIAAWSRQAFQSAETLVRIGRASQADQFRNAVFLKRYLQR